MTMKEDFVFKKLLFEIIRINSSASRQPSVFDRPTMFDARSPPARDRRFGQEPAAIFVAFLQAEPISVWPLCRTSTHTIRTATAVKRRTNTHDEIVAIPTRWTIAKAVSGNASVSTIQSLPAINVADAATVSEKVASNVAQQIGHIVKISSPQRQPGGVPQWQQPPSDGNTFRGDGGTSLAGFIAKNPEGLSRNPM